LVPKQEGSERMVRSGPPKQLLLQWHITDRCNLRCRHCYQNDYREHGPDYRHLLGILDQYEMLLEALGGNGKRIPGQINITGGEPFVRKDFLQLLKEIRRRGIPFAILSNGSLLDQATARVLETLAPRFVQLSLEGGEAMHDAIRSKGDYARVVGSLRLLKMAGIRTLVSFTAHRGNFLDFPAVADRCRRIGVDRLWSDRF
jgi:MoaA/NifB/PqqE/SkfB family radical SAM enzyme